ncbi:conserved hypothetical protein [Vibrio crassostreae]|nr:conserved hypothetical protein [Vibrio crassostreae]
MDAFYHDKECIGESNKCTPPLYEGHSAVQAYILVYTIEMVIFSLNCNWLCIHELKFGTSIHAIWKNSVFWDVGREL